MRSPRSATGGSSPPARCSCADGSSRMVALRLLPTGEIDPSFGAGLGYVLAGPSAWSSARWSWTGPATSSSAAGAGRRRRRDADRDPAAARRQPGRDVRRRRHAGRRRRSAWPAARPGLLARPEGTLTWSTGAGPGAAAPATFTTVRLLANGAPDPAFGGTGVVTVPLGPGERPGHRRERRARRPGRHDARRRHRPDGRPARRAARSSGCGRTGRSTRRFGRDGIARVARAGRDIRFTAMVRDGTGRILLAGTGRPPNAIVVRLRASGARDSTLRQRRPDLPAARPPARRRRRSTRRSTRSTRPVRAPCSPAPPPARARSCAARPARSTPAASRSPSRDCA